MMTDTTAFGPMRTSAKAEGWTLPRTGWADGPPDQVSETVIWCESDGAPITDEARIADLEAKHAQEAD